MSHKKRKRPGKKVRIEFRKGYDERSRRKDVDPSAEDESAGQTQRVSGKGALTRKRTVVTQPSDESATDEGMLLDVDLQRCLPGRVLSVHGTWNDVLADDGRRFQCAVRGLLKSLATELRHVVVAGDRVMFLPQGDDQGLIVRIEQRRGEISRVSRGKRHVMVTNVDQLLIITSAAMPALKPNLIDRFLIVAEQAKIRPLICINKVDLVSLADLQTVVGIWSQLGYRVLLTSIVEGTGLARLRQVVEGRASVVVGQSGVGKSSLANAIEPGLNLKVAHVSRETEKGRHTTTTARLFPLEAGGFLIDTPGVRQFQLWDVIAEEVAGYFREIRPFVNHCRFPDCTHRHEDWCAVKDAVADGKIDPRRYESYCGLFEENQASGGNVT